MPSKPQLSFCWPWEQRCSCSERFFAAGWRAEGFCSSSSPFLRWSAEPRSARGHGTRPGSARSAARRRSSSRPNSEARALRAEKSPGRPMAVIWSGRTSHPSSIGPRIGRSGGSTPRVRSSTHLRSRTAGSTSIPTGGTSTSSTRRAGASCGRSAQGIALPPRPWSRTRSSTSPLRLHFRASATFVGLAASSSPGMPPQGASSGDMTPLRSKRRRCSSESSSTSVPGTERSPH